jgi:predicted dehydrogenase
MLGDDALRTTACPWRDLMADSDAPVRSEPVRVGLAGYGYWGRNLARNVVAAKGTELVAVADPNEAARAAARASLPGVRVFADYRAMLDDDAVEAVILATAPFQHGPMAREAIESKRHVLVEKPLAMNVQDSEELVALAEQADRTLMVGHTFLYSPPVERLRRYIVDGELGEVLYLYSQRLNLGRIRRDCNALWNFGPHDISIMLYLIGDRPVEVSARGFSFIGEGVDDVCFGSLIFGSGIGANLHVSWIDPRKTRLVTVVGDSKMAIYDDVSVDQKIRIIDAGVAAPESRSLGRYESLGDFQWRTRVGDIVIPNIPMTEPLLREIEAFGRACSGQEPPLTDGRHGTDVVRVLEALDESARRRGAPVAVRW